MYWKVLNIVMNLCELAIHLHIHYSLPCTGLPTFRTQYHTEVLMAQWALTLLSIDAFHAFTLRPVENLLSSYCQFCRILK